MKPAGCGVQLQLYILQVCKALTEAGTRSGAHATQVNKIGPHSITS